METDAQFCNVNIGKDESIGTDEMMVMLINMLSSAIKVHYKNVKGLLNEIDFENKNVRYNKEKVDLIGNALKWFLNEAKDIFWKLKVNHKHLRNRSIECDISCNSNCQYSVNKSNAIMTNGKKSKLEIITKMSNPFEKRVISSLNCSINSSQNNSTLNVNKHKQIHKASSTRNSNGKSCNNESICLIKEIISKIKEIFPNGKSSFQYDNNKSQMNNLLSLLNQLMNILSSANKTSKSPSLIFQSPNNSRCLSPVQSPLFNKTNKKLFINGLNYHHNNKSKLSLNKHQRNNSKSSSTTSQNINNNINDISYSNTSKIVPQQQSVLNNSVNSHIYSKDNSKSKYKTKDKNASLKHTNVLMKELQNKIELLENELKLKNQEINELQFNNNSIDTTQIDIKTRNVRNNSHIKSSSIGEFDETTLKDTLKNASRQSEMQFKENEEKLQKRINELNAIILQQQQMINKDSNINTKKEFVIEQNATINYNKDTPKFEHNYHEEKQRQNIKNDNEITTFYFDISENVLRNHKNQLNDELLLIQTQKDKLQEELKVITEKNNVLSESYEQLVNNLSLKEFSLSQSKDEIINLTNQIKSLQFKVFHLEYDSNNSYKSVSPSNSKERPVSSTEKSHYHNLSKEKLISNMEILKKENDKFAKECAKLHNDINIKNLDFLELQTKNIHLEHYYKKELKENENTISDLKESLKHKSDMLLSQATELENLISVDKQKDKIIEELKNNEKVNNNENLTSNELIKQPEVIGKKDMENNVNLHKESNENIGGKL